MNLVVYTAVIGSNTDSLKDPSPEALASGARFVCFTDQPIESKTWQIERVDLGVIGPVWAARCYAVNPHRWFDGADATLWMDAAYELLVSPVEIADRYLWRHDICAFRHPRWSTLREEADAIARTDRAPRVVLERQLGAYRDRGFPVEQGKDLTTTGFLLRRYCRRVVEHSEVLWKEMIEWGHTRVQMAFDVAACDAEVDIGYLPGSYLGNEFAKWHPGPPGG